MDPLNFPAGSDPFAKRRADLVAQIETDAVSTAPFTGRERLSAAVLAALAKVPRHRFVPPEYEEAAYFNSPLSIGFGQTISQPYIVALMTDLLELHSDAVVLEIGGGSGYQAAVLAELACHVYSIERVGELAEAARKRLAALGYANVEVIAGDGYYGCPEHAPYDAVIVTAAAPDIPPPLLEQLKQGGRMVLPLGLPYGDQELTLVRKGEDGAIDRQGILPVAFVPFLHSA